MKNVVLLHGKPKRERYQDPTWPKPHVANWFSWLQRELGGAGIPSVAPALPRPYAPDYEANKEVIDRLPIDEETVLIGLSFGAGLILRAMSEDRELIVAKAILVAPWVDPRGNYGDLFDFTVDPSLPERTREGVTVFYSSQDDEQAQTSLEIVSAALPNVTYRDIPSYGHFMLGNTMTTREFPEILPEIITN